MRLDVSGTNGVSRGVADGELDLGLCSAPPAELGLDFEPLFAEEMALLIPRGHRLAGRKPLRARDLEGEPLLLTEQGCSYRRAIETALQEHGVRPQWSVESGGTETLKAAVRQKMGIAILPRAAVSPAPPGTVVRSLSDLVIALPVGLATRPDSAPAPPALALLVASLRRALAANAGSERAVTKRRVPPAYSLRRTRFGSTESARRAGTQQARRPAARSSAATAA